jgi:hypothetical protein
LPKIKGKYLARKITTLKVSGLVTGASYNEKTLVLIGYSSFIPFINKYSITSLGKIADKQATTYILNEIATYQTEGICFDGSRIFISSEKTRSPAQIIEVFLK